MYGDTEAIRLLARGLRRLGDDIRWEADSLLAAAEAVPWQGVAADVMRCLAKHRVGQLRRTATLHDAAASALDDHADAVDQIKALIAAIENQVMSMIAGAKDRIAGLVGGLVDPLDDLLDRFVPPPSGHKDWLGVDLPGVDLPGLPDIDLPFVGRAA